MKTKQEYFEEISKLLQEATEKYKEDFFGVVAIRDEDDLIPIKLKGDIRLSVPVIFNLEKIGIDQCEFSPIRQALICLQEDLYGEVVDEEKNQTKPNEYIHYNLKGDA